MTGTAGRVAQGARQVSFAHAHRAGEDDVFFAFNEVKSKKLVQSCFIQRNLGSPVEAFECAFLFEAGLAQTALNRYLLPTFRLVAENEFEKLGIIKLLASSKGQSVRQCVQNR
jgi:hypothetical protein